MSWSQLLAHLQWSDPPAPPSSSASVSASPSSASRLIVLQDSLSTPSDAVFLAFVWSKLSGGGRVAVVLTQRSIPHCHAAALKAVSRSSTAQQQQQQCIMEARLHRAAGADGC